MEPTKGTDGDQSECFKSEVTPFNQLDEPPDCHHVQATIDFGKSGGAIVLEV
jgi:hypothetical protein